MNAAALSFDGVDDYATAAHHADLVLGATATVEFWARATSPGPFKYLLAKTDGGTTGLAVYTGSTGTLRFYYGHGAGLYVADPLPTSPWDGAWHHLALVRDTTTIAVYVDGAPALGATGLPPGTSPDPGPLSVGAWTDGTLNFPGQLDELRLWNVARTAAEVAAYKDVRAAGDEPGLVACWHCDEGTGTTAADAAGTSQPLTLVGATWWTGTLPPLTGGEPEPEPEPPAGDGALVGGASRVGALTGGGST